jgi:hypothetical protein
MATDWTYTVRFTAVNMNAEIFDGPDEFKRF